MAEDDHDDRRDSNSSSESDFGGLFDEVDPKSSIFYFDRMTIHRNEEDNYTQVIFTYSYMHKYNFESKLYIPSYVPRNLDKIIFSIGMCHLLWYWMGFGTDLIQISNNYSISESTRSFWEVFYNTVTLEFKYLHPSISKITLQNSTQESDPPFIQESSIPLFAYTEQPNYRQGIPITIPPMSVKDKSNSSTSSSSSDDDRVLCPLGGGKDSLVVWKQCIDKECVPVLLYCCDTLYEFEANWRVQKLARRMQSPLFIIRHDFRSELFEQQAQSYLYPCGHPWAALVMFDSVLACELYGIKEAWFGCERSADEGNGVTWCGEEVNHQYDKSSHFFHLANQYIKHDLQLSVEISSPLTRIWELEIARKFCSDPLLKSFHPIFLSCNESSKTNNWCCNCEKCCFIHLLMSAWLSPVEVQSVFMSRSFSSCDYVSEFANTTANTTEVSTTISPLSSLPSVNNGCLYESGSLLPMFMKLIGGDSNKIKAFECVGTFSEASAAVELSLYQYQRLDLAIPPILRSLCEYLGIEIMKSTSQNDHTFDVCMEELVKNICRKWNIDEITIS